MKDDTISRRSAIDTALRAISDLQGKDSIRDKYIISEMEEIPSAERWGRWIDMGDFEQCSVCHGTHLKVVQTYYGEATWVKTPYCHNCGAKMDLEDCSQLPVNENRASCKLRHENGNCLCIGGFCTAVNDEICKAIRMSYEKGYIDGKMDKVEE